jgi:hypothetical protein
MRLTYWVAGFCVVLTMSACATCRSSDTVEQCRTKQRDNGQTRAALPGPEDLTQAAL